MNPQFPNPSWAQGAQGRPCGSSGLILEAQLPVLRDIEKSDRLQKKSQVLRILREAMIGAIVRSDGRIPTDLDWGDRLHSCDR